MGFEDSVDVSFLEDFGNFVGCSLDEGKKRLGFVF
jgi:hypothetical protein